MWTERALRNVRHRPSRFRRYLGRKLTISVSALAMLGVGAAGYDALIQRGWLDAPLPLVHTQGQSDATASARPPRNCAEARAWGLRNIPRGSPYYAPWLDADNDGLACEPWPRLHR